MLEAYRNRYAGKRAFILGNGPSLNMLDLSKLAGEVTFGTNGIFYLFDRMGFKPTFYVVEARPAAGGAWERILWRDGRVVPTHSDTPGDALAFLAPGRYELRAWIDGRLPSRIADFDVPSYRQASAIRT